MKTWHIAALVVVGLIVAGIAYTMYEKRKVGMVRKVGGGGKAQLLSEGTPKTNSGVPGLGEKVEPERPARPEYNIDYGEWHGRQVYGPTRAGFERILEKRKRDYDTWDDAEFWNYL